MGGKSQDPMVEGVKRILQLVGSSGSLLELPAGAGAVEPLLWLYNYKPKFGHPYWFSTPLRLPRGTRIEVSPAQAGSVVLLSAKTK